MPGAPDLYQGSEFPLYTLVDPDNRGIVAFPPPDPRPTRETHSPDAEPTENGPTGLAAEKAALTRTALRLRAALAAKADYSPWPTPSPHALAFLRADSLLTVVTRLPYGLARAGGWRDATLALPDGTWTEALTDRHGFTGAVPLAELLSPLPVALFVRS
jgi:(1->4)-alpha-D-glucan 1-alpha-D-glucosylmutase